MARTEDDLMISLKAGTSVFKFIPDDIGEILYCDSNNPKAEPDTKEQTRKKLILSVVIPAAIIAFCWLVFNESPIFDSIVSVIMGIISIYSISQCLSFSGKDYFVGSEGAAEIAFDKTRDNITSKTEVYFKDFEDMVTSETRNYKNRVYQGTDYTFVVYGHEVDNQKKVVTSIQSSYHQEKPEGYYEDRIYRYWKKIEACWSQYKLALIKDSLNRGEAIGFNVYTDKAFYDNYIVFQGKQLTIHGKVYDKSNIKDLYFKNGNLIIEDVNHSSKLFGLIQKGDKENIPLSIIGNRELFLTFFQYFVSTL